MAIVYVIILLAIVRSTYQTLYSCNSTVACGCSSNPATVTRIVGGEEAGIATWGWAVSISIADGYELCGGSILSSSWIITAAHCLNNISPASIIVYAGSNIVWSGTQNLSVSEVIVHSNYNAETFENDIALLKLAEPLNMSDPDVSPICMPLVSSTTLQSGEWPVANTTVVAIGWGTLSEGGSLPDNLQQVTVQTIDYQETSCSSFIYNKQVQLCAGIPDGGKDTCQGDSGGPLMIFTSDNQWVLVGLTSFGDGCAQKNKSGVYTRVAAYEDWIKSYTNDSYWLAMDSHANNISTSITRLFFFIAPLCFLLAFFQ